MTTQWIALLLLLAPALAAADTYKCTDDQGRKTYSDQPCPSSSAQVKLPLQDSDWLERLRSEARAGIEIRSVSRDAGGVTIKYRFERQEQSNTFLRAATQLSGQDAALLKYFPPSKNQKGSAAIRVSDQLPSLLPGKTGQN